MGGTLSQANSASVPHVISIAKLHNFRVRQASGASAASRPLRSKGQHNKSTVCWNLRNCVHTKPSAVLSEYAVGPCQQ